MIINNENDEKRPPFYQYPKILNCDNNLFLKELKELDMMNEECVATEKIHGSNLVLIANGDNLYVGKRTSYLGGDSYKKFFYTERIIKEHGYKICELSKILNDIVYVYGEQYGGLYPHKNVKAIPKTKPIQKGVYYCADIRFAPFDIRVEKRGFLPYDESRKLLKEVGFSETDLPTEVARGTWKEMLQLKVDDKVSCIPSKLNLPLIENNIWEGVVLRSTTSKHRMMSKLKCEKYKEMNINDERRQEIEKILDESTKYIELIKAYINRNRIDNMISKQGDGIHKRKLAFLVVKDAIVDIQNDMKDDSPLQEYFNKSKQYQNVINKALMDYCITLY